MNKYFKYIIIVLIACILSWLIPFTKGEILTYKYGENFKECYKENTMIGNIELLKVMKYSDSYAEVYYVAKDYSFGTKLSFEKTNGEWRYKDWLSPIWSMHGTGDDIIWPYFYHRFFHKCEYHNGIFLK